jgi:hypothetical protein
MMSKNRFHTTDELNTEIIDKLELLGFSKLPNCMSKPYAHLKKTIIDTKTKTFWCLDKVCFENSVVTISNQFQENILEFNIDDLFFNEAKELDLSNETLESIPNLVTDFYSDQTLFTPAQEKITRLLLKNSSLPKKPHKAIGSDFKDYLKNARIDFCKKAHKYYVEDYLDLRTSIDSFLIAYDQACHKLYDSKKPHKAIETQEITLLDYFAAKAMQGELSSQDENTSFRTSGVSQRAYQIAREMMEIRKINTDSVK